MKHPALISSPELKQQGENTAGTAPAEPQHRRVNTQRGTAASRGQGQISMRSPGHCCRFSGARESRGMWSQTPAWLFGVSAAVCRSRQSLQLPRACSALQTSRCGGRRDKKSTWGRRGRFSMTATPFSEVWAGGSAFHRFSCHPVEYLVLTGCVPRDAGAHRAAPPQHDSPWGGIVPALSTSWVLAQLSQPDVPAPSSGGHPASKGIHGCRVTPAARGLRIRISGTKGTSLSKNKLKFKKN